MMGSVRGSAKRPLCRDSASCLACLGVCISIGASAAFADEVNIAPYCTVHSTPYLGAGVAYLTDGKIASAADNTLMLAAPLGPRIGDSSLQYEFIFPTRTSVTGVRMFQADSYDRKAAREYVIELDTNGTGHYDRTVVAESAGRGGAWLSYRVTPAITAYGLRFRTVHIAADVGSNFGPPAIEEFEILADSDAPPVSRPILAGAPKLEADAEHADEISFALKNARMRSDAVPFRRGLFGSMWLFWSAGHSYDDQGNKDKMALLGRLNVNRYWLYPEVYVPRGELPYVTLPQNADYLFFVRRQAAWRTASGAKEMPIVPFPSRVVPGHRENALRPLVAQMHASGIRVVANESLLPFGLESWDFPRVIDPTVYPSVLSSSFVREASTAFYSEFMEAGVDGLALGGDEFFLYGSPGIDEERSPICRGTGKVPRAICKPTTMELFRRRFDRDFDVLAKKYSPAAARWKVFQYEQLAALFAHYRDSMKSFDSDAIVSSLFRPGEENRPAFGVAYDVMGWVGQVDEMSSDPYWSHNSFRGHYYFASEAKKLSGASRSGEAVISLQATPRFDRDGYENPLMVYGPAFSALMNGARGVNFYKHDYLFAGGRNDAGPWVEKFFKLTALLDTRGLQAYQAPKAVALVYSRASEDWWQMARARDGDAAQAIVYQNAVMEVLFRNGIPFDLYFLDQPSSLEKLDQYRTMILAYPYSISMSALDKIRRAIGRGTRILSLWHAGEVDEYGEPYEEPVLRHFAGVEPISVDLSRSDYAQFARWLLSALVDALGAGVPLSLEAAGRDVECSVRERGDSRLVFCLNWEQEPIDINVGVSLPAGTYSAEMITMQQQAPARIRGRSRLTASDLRSFRLVLGPGDAMVVAISPVAPALAASK